MKLLATVTMDFTDALTLGFTISRTIGDNEDKARQAPALAEFYLRDNERLQRLQNALDIACETHNMRLVEA